MPERPRPSWLSHGEIEHIAKGVASAARLKPSGPLGPVVEFLGGQIITTNDRNLLYRGASGLKVDGPRDFVISINEFVSPLWARVVTAYHIGHYVLHSQWGKVPILVNRNIDYLLFELEADFFAANLLMPNGIFPNGYLEYQWPS